MFVGAEHGDGGTRLGQPVGVGEVGVREERHRAFDDAQGHLAAAVGKRLQVRHAGGLLAFERGDDSRQHRRHHEGGGDAFGASRLDPRIGAEVGKLHHAPPGVDGTQGRGDAGDVVRRHAHQRRVVLLRGHELDGTDDVGDEMSMAQHRRFRRAGGAAGEQQHADVFRVHRTLLVRIAASFGNGEKRVSGAGVHAFPPLEARQAVVVRHQIGGRHSGQQGVDFVRRQAIVDGHVGHPGPAACEQRHGHGDVAHVQHRHPAGAGFADVVSGGPGRVVERLVGDRLAARRIGEGEPFAEAASGHLEEHHRVHGVSTPCLIERRRQGCRSASTAELWQVVSRFSGASWRPSRPTRRCPRRASRRPPSRKALPTSRPR